MTIEDVDIKQTQKTYMVLLESSNCDSCTTGYKVRTTRKWINSGMPLCPHGVELTEEEK